MKRLIQMAALALALVAPAQAHAQTQDRASTLRVVVHANLQILDPVWTTAFITNRHAYLIYDTLYAMNSR
ncbi:MAG: gsiB 1, partial [Rubritepida sp.]|nr:gsiB 1 [Rubritepida sp.]